METASGELRALADVDHPTRTADPEGHAHVIACEFVHLHTAIQNVARASAVKTILRGVSTRSRRDDGRWSVDARITLSPELEDMEEEPPEGGFERKKTVCGSLQAHMRTSAPLWASALLLWCCSTPRPEASSHRAVPKTPLDALRDATEHNDAAAAVELALAQADSGRALLCQRRQSDGGTVLHEAVRGNRLAAAAALLRSGADASARNDQGDTPLHLVRSPEMVALLCAAGADVHAVNDRGIPVGAVDQSAGRRMMRRIAEALTDAGATEDLRTAVMCRPVADVRRILASAPGLDDCLLHHAARRGDVPVVRALVSAGCPVERYCSGRFGNVQEFGDNPLTTAVQHANYAAAAVLLAAGAPVEGNAWPASRHGRPQGTLLARAAQEAPVSFVEALLAAGAEPRVFEHSPDEEHSALARAAGHGRDDVVRLLLKAGADVAEVSNGVTPLFNAAVMGHQSTFDLLVRSGARPSFLELSAAGRAASVRRMLESGVTELDSPDGLSGKTPLMWAVALGHGDVVRALLEGGADPNRRGEESWRTVGNWYSCVHGTPADFNRCPVEEALSAGRVDLLDLLVAQGATLTGDDRARLACTSRKGASADVVARREIDTADTAFEGDERIVAGLLAHGTDPPAVLQALERCIDGREHEAVIRRALLAAGPCGVANGWILSAIVERRVRPGWMYDHADAGSRTFLRESANDPHWIACARMLLDAGADPRTGHTLDLVEAWAGRPEATPEFRALADECWRRVGGPRGRRGR